MRKSNFYGRRIGRPLNNLNKTLLEKYLPKYSLLDLENRNEEIHPSSIFPGTTEFSLEIGFGTGSHLFSQAINNPKKAFIGSEPYISGVSQLLKTLQESPLDNLRISLKPAQELLQFFQKEVFDHIYILFPDPWPKARHNKRRIISSQKLDFLSKYLKPKGKITIATDHPDYTTWMEESFQSSQSTNLVKTYTLEAFSRPPNWPITRFEKKAHQAGRKCTVFELSLKNLT